MALPYESSLVAISHNRAILTTDSNNLWRVN
jgi:hypothetical protein